MSGPDAEYLDWAKRRLGTVVKDKYQLEKLLGVGGMASVYSATHRNGRHVALKVLHPDLSMRADLRTRFRRECQAANAVHHPGVVAIIDDDIDDDGSAFIVMELLEGNVLEKIWEDHHRRLPATLVLAIAREVCDVLAVAHAAGIVHRDIKPENLFLTNDAQLKVLDFGLAHLNDLARPGDTHTGMVFGTPAFMPPEQAAGRTSEIDERTDLWAVGASMFTMLSGTIIHEGESLQHIVMLAATYPARSLAEVLPGAHPVLVDLVDRALTWEKERRWPNAAAMRDAIDAACITLFGEARPELMSARDLIVEQTPVPTTERDEDEATRTDQTLALLEPPVPPPIESGEDQTDVRQNPLVETIGESIEEEFTELDRTKVRQSISEPEDHQEHTSVMAIRAAQPSQPTVPALPRPPRLEAATMRLAPRAPVLPWVLAVVATLIALLAIGFAVAQRHAH